MDLAILVIEDDPDHQFLLFTQLTRRGFDDVKVVDSLEQGFGECGQRPRDVVVVDSGLAGEDRATAITRFRADCPGARVIAYSAGHTLDPWADAHFLKGEDVDGLLEEIAKGRTEA